MLRSLSFILLFFHSLFVMWITIYAIRQSGCSIELWCAQIMWNNVISVLWNYIWNRFTWKYRCEPKSRLIWWKFIFFFFCFFMPAYPYEFLKWIIHYWAWHVRWMFFSFFLYLPLAMASNSYADRSKGTRQTNWMITFQRSIATNSRKNKKAHIVTNSLKPNGKRNKNPLSHTNTHKVQCTHSFGFGCRFFCCMLLLATTGLA